jgi:hypothetical protein
MESVSAIVGVQGITATPVVQICAAGLCVSVGGTQEKAASIVSDFETD